MQQQKQPEQATHTWGKIILSSMNRIMKNIFLTMLGIFCLAPFILAQTGPAATTTVTFILSAPELADNSQVFICGSNEQLGNWDPGKVSMKYTGNHTWSKQITLTEPQTIEYKYTLGSWKRQATTADGQPLQNFSVRINGDTTIKDEVKHWIEQPEMPAVASKVTGTVKLHTNIRGAGVIPNRDVVVWLPPSYDKGKRYPVLYMHDGQNIFNPATSSFGVDWRIDETADSLIRAKVIEPIIVVGIYNTPDRMDEYTPGQKGSAYMDYVVNAVKPFIDQAYHTKPGRKHTMVGGSSAGGIISFMLAWEYPNVFSRAICMSPAFKIQHIDYVKDVLAYTGKKKKLYFYIDNGGIELEERLQPGIDEMLEAMKQKGYRQGKDYIWIKDPQAKHFEAAWAKRMPEALKWILSR